jgi:hypothetical protein
MAKEKMSTIRFFNHRVSWDLSELIDFGTRVEDIEPSQTNIDPEVAMFT